MDERGARRRLLRGRTVLVVALCAVALLAALLRWRYQAEILARDPLQCGALLDTAAYLDEAALVRREGPLAPALSYRPPGYPWLLAALQAAGLDARGILGFQALLDALSVLGVGWLAFACTRSAVAAVAAALLLAAAPSSVYFSAELLETSAMVFAVVLFLVLFALALAREPPSRAVARFAACGLALGLAVLIRPNALLLLPFALLAAGGRAGPRATLATLAGALLVIAPVTAKNVLLGGEPVLVSANGGVNLYLGNVQDDALHGPVPMYAELPGPVAGDAWRRLGERAWDAGARTTGAADRWHAAEAWRALRAAPSRAGVLLGKKLVQLANAFELSNNRDVYREGSALRDPRLAWASWGVLLPLLAVGIATRRHDPQALWRWLALFGAVLALSVVLFFVSARHRAPLLPVACVFGGIAVAELPAMLRFPRRGLALAALGAAVFLLARVDWLGQRPRYAGYEIDPVGIGNLEARRGDYPLAAAAYERALVRAPDDRLALSNLGALHLEVGHFSEAEDLFHRTLALDPSDARTENKLGLCYFEQGRWQEAGRAFERAVSLEPAFALAWANRGRAMERQERDVEAQAAFAEARRLLGAEAFAELMAVR